MLQIDDLVRLEAAWRAQGAPIAERLAPGLTNTRCEELEAASSLTLPGELRRWWGWHDGVQGGGRNGGNDSALGAGPWHFLSLQDALDERAEQLARNPEPYHPDQPFWDGEWAAWWLPVASAGSAHLFADLSAAGSDGVPIHLWAQQPDDVFTPQFASLGEVVVRAADGLERGYFTWSQQLQEWQIADALPMAFMDLL